MEREEQPLLEILLIIYSTRYLVIETVPENDQDIVKQCVILSEKGNVAEYKKFCKVLHVYLDWQKAFLKVLPKLLGYS